MNQYLTPLADALMAESEKNALSFDVPGHRGNIKELKKFFGEKCVTLDLNSRASIDNLQKPTSVIAEAEALAADAFSAQDAFFMVGGTTSAVQAMIMSVCNPGEKIILPRNVHASVVDGVILAGAIPVYINPGIHSRLGISLGMNLDDLKETIANNPDARAVLVNNPTYYGICSNIKKIIEIAHKNSMLVIADEAHGTHFYFSEKLPDAAMQCGADLSAVSMHKSGGSFTQSSILLIGENIDSAYVRKIVNLTRTTSASYLLLASLDIARKHLAIHGKSELVQVLKMAEKTRDEINKIDGLYAYGKELIDHKYVENFDVTKISVFTADIGLAGIEVYNLLRQEYNIQIELGDVANILALVTIGDADNEKKLKALVNALSNIKNRNAKNTNSVLCNEYFNPIIKMSPREAFYSKKKEVPTEKSVGEICGEFIMSYPPGIPIVAPGELITKEILHYIQYASQKGCIIMGNTDSSMSKIEIISDN